MIAPLRRRHRLITGGLALALPVLYIVALAARPDEPVNPRLPAMLAGTGDISGDRGEIDNDFGDLLTDPPIIVRSRKDAAGGSWWLELEPRSPVAHPELLVYWSRSQAAGRLPEDAYLLGSLAGDRRRLFALPEDALGIAGFLVLYSLGHQEMIASSPVPAIGRAAAEGSPAEGSAADLDPPAGESPDAAGES